MLLYKKIMKNGLIAKRKLAWDDLIDWGASEFARKRF